MRNKYNNDKLFQETEVIEIIKDFVKSMDFIEIKIISRKDFDSLKWDFLQNTWKNNIDNEYQLFIPNDLKNIELINYIDYIWEKFNIKNSKNYKDYIKIHIWYILKSMWKKDGPKYLLNLKNEYKISDNFINTINNHLLKYSKNVKNIIKEEKNYDINNAFEKVFKEFISTIFYKSQDLITNNFESITNYEQDNLIHFCENFWFKKNIEHNITEYTKWNENLIIHKNSNNLDKKNIKIIEKLDLKKYKWTLNNFSNDTIVKTLNKLCNEINNYPFFQNKSFWWYSPTSILKNKELFCTWFSIVWYSFLEYLWITNYWLNFTDHSSILVKIWSKYYIFDPSCFKELKEVKIWKKIWNYNNIILENIDYPDFWQIWNTKNILLSQIFNTKWYLLNQKWDYKNALNTLKTALLFNPNCTTTYLNLWITHYWLNNFKLSCNNYKKSLICFPENNLAKKNLEILEKNI